jgi:uncharacterized protein (TIGR02391 family)
MREDLLSNLEYSLGLPTHELAHRLLAEIPKHIQNGIFHPDSVTRAVVDGPIPADLVPRPNFQQKQRLEVTLATAFNWLEQKALIVKAPGINGTNGFRVLAPEGVKLANKPAFDQFRAAEMFPESSLHPRLQGQIWAAAVRGEFDNAVAQAFKLLEERVRAAGKFTNSDFGVSLMRAAFKPGSGPLTDTTQDGGEQQGCMDLFAGATGAFKNASSHRTIPYSGIREVQQTLMFVSLLLHIIDTRTSGASPP